MNKRINWVSVWEKVGQWQSTQLVCGFCIPDVEEKKGGMFRLQDFYLASMPKDDEYNVIMKEIKRQGIKIDWKKCFTHLGYCMYAYPKSDFEKTFRRLVNKYRIKD
jgi:hypothetical protein